ncbi:sensor histidine kinase [Lactiplantibacillus plajomi]|uniref:Sensor histidine kinase n=1 Tax=Lactiplantibacillus plajomi TaxID=1457217 RepID=A0ABV6K1T2_9LACO|nr:GHKL domain-containing protein [Lactiplantibacillus plajomi]
MAALLLVLSLMSGTYEMIFFMIAFREYLTWRIAIVWILVFLANAIFCQWANAMWPQVPLVFFFIIPMVLSTTVMSTWLLATHWILMLPIAIFLNAFKRLIGAITGVLTRYAMHSDAPMFLRQALGIKQAADINLFLAVLIELPIVILLSLWVHHWMVKHAVADFLQRARVEISDYLLVLLFFAIYITAYVFAMESSLVNQTYMAIAACVTFGIIGFYLISNKNSHLNDDQLLKQMSVYNELLSHHNRDLHLFKHDYQNILLSMATLLERHDYQALEQYFNQEVLPSGAALNQATDLDVLRYLESPVVSGLIYAKHNLAAERQLKLTVTIMDTIKLPAVSQVRVVRILGNLLDNALDAAAHSNQRVTLDISCDDHQNVIFSIQNQIPKQEQIDLNVIKKGRFTTKAGHLGYGLSSIKQLMTDQLQVNYQVDHNLFKAQLILAAE